MVRVVQIVQAVRKVQTRLGYILSTVVLVLSAAGGARAQAPADKVVVSYPSKSITNFPILETAKQRGFFQKEGLNVSAVYMRGGIDIKALLTGDADFGTGSTTAVTAFVAGAPLRVIMSLNAYVDQGLYAQPKYRSLAKPPNFLENRKHSMASSAPQAVQLRLACMTSSLTANVRQGFCSFSACRNSNSVMESPSGLLRNDPTAITHGIAGQISALAAIYVGGAIGRWSDRSVGAFG
jgi:NMT1/THI5 like